MTASCTSARWGADRAPSGSSTLTKKSARRCTTPACGSGTSATRCVSSTSRCLDRARTSRSIRPRPPEPPETPDAPMAPPAPLEPRHFMRILAPAAPRPAPPNAPAPRPHAADDLDGVRQASDSLSTVLQCTTASPGAPGLAVVFPADAVRRLPAAIPRIEHDVADVVARDLLEPRDELRRSARVAARPWHPAIVRSITRIAAVLRVVRVISSEDALGIDVDRQSRVPPVGQRQLELGRFLVRTDDRLDIDRRSPVPARLEIRQDVGARVVANRQRQDLGPAGTRHGTRILDRQRHARLGTQVASVEGHQAVTRRSLEERVGERPGEPLAVGVPERRRERTPQVVLAAAGLDLDIPAAERAVRA